MTKFAPILISVYTRLEALNKSVISLQQNDLALQSDLFIVSDAPANSKDVEAVKNVRSYVKSINGFKSVTPIFREKNLGFFDSIIPAILETLDKYGKIIFLEDDVVVSRAFLQFLNDGLEILQNNHDVFSISGYTPVSAYREDLTNRVLRAPYHCPWGFGTWRDRLLKVDMSYNPYEEVLRNRGLVKYMAKNAVFMLEALRQDFYFRNLNYVDVRISFQMLLKGMFSVFPAVSLTRNIGFDGRGLRSPIDKEIMNQPIAEFYNQNCWVLNRNLEFEKQIVTNGQKKGLRTLFFKILFYTGLIKYLKPRNKKLDG